MDFTGRSRELGALRAILDRATPQVVRVVGLPGVGKSALVRQALDHYPCAWCTCPPLPDPLLRTRVAAAVREVEEEAGAALGDTPAWEHLLDAALAPDRDGRPRVLVLDDAHRLTEARSRFAQSAVAVLRKATASGRAPHLVLVGRASGLPPVDAFADLPSATVVVPPLPLRAAAPHLPGVSPDQRIRAYGVFGGIPRVLASLDTSVTVGTNVRRLLLSPSGPLHDALPAWLEREVQTPSRYFAILRALAPGETDWAAIHAGVPDLTRSGQLAPYLNRLVDAGFVTVRTSLESRPRSRSKRYRLSDPFLSFWLRFAVPWRYRDGSDAVSTRTHYAERIRPLVDDHLATVMPVVARQHMRHDALATLGAAPREQGSLWGDGYDIPVAGILTSGAAYYGACTWATPARDASPLDALDRQVKETRYGFGRERRLRLLFTGRGAPAWLRRDAARRSDVELIDAEALVGS